MTATDTHAYVTLIDEPDYEIATEYPFKIRRRDNGFEPNESVSNGYVLVTLNNRTYLKHILMAKQFIPNDDPEHKTQVDHINHDRGDYHIENLRWVSPSENNLNKSSNKGVQYEFIDDIPDDAIVVDRYDTRTERRLFDEGRYYYFNDDGEDVFYCRVSDNLYRVMHVNTLRSGTRFVSMKDINHHYVSVYLTRFKYLYDLE